jgi:DNA-binding NarL/FixJ family response regulator
MADHTRVLIVDDSERIRRGLRGLLELAEEVELVAEAANGAEGVRLAERLAPDIVLMDLAMPVMDGIMATREIRASRPETRVLVVTALPGQEQAARTAGADAVLLKDADPLELLRVIRSLAEPLPLGP